ncbi:MAG TPA: hypothetical protein VIX84_12660, partial [Acidimicrobiales bacterium]
MLWSARALTAAFGTAAILGFVVVPAALWPGTANAAGPSALKLSNTTLAPGESVTINGKGWPPGQEF